MTCGCCTCRSTSGRSLASCVVACAARLSGQERRSEPPTSGGPGREVVAAWYLVQRRWFFLLLVLALTRANLVKWARLAASARRRRSAGPSVRSGSTFCSQ